MSEGATVQELDPRLPFWMWQAILGMGILAIGYGGFVIGSGIPLPFAAGATLCERLAFLSPMFMGVVGMAMIMTAIRLREVTDR
jgi:hypothetical protein